jgi:hypothetical protein
MSHGFSGQSDGNGNWWKCIFASACFVICAAGIVAWIYLALTKDDRADTALWLPLLPFGIFPIYAFLSLAGFPLPYSALGTRKKTRCPEELPELVLPQSWGRFGQLNCSWPMVSWHVYRAGIGISISLFGKVFLPKDAIVSIERDWLGRCVITHTCEEVRSPILAPGRLGELVHKVWWPENASATSMNGRET